MQSYYYITQKNFKVLDSYEWNADDLYPLLLQDQEERSLFIPVFATELDALRDASCRCSFTRDQTLISAPAIVKIRIVGESVVGTVSRQNILFIEAAKLRKNGPTREYTSYDFLLTSNTYKDALALTKNTDAYIAALTQYKSGKWGVLPCGRKNKPAATRLIDNIKTNADPIPESKEIFRDPPSLLTLFRQELNKPKTNDNGAYNKTLKTLIAEEIKRTHRI